MFTAPHRLCGHLLQPLPDGAFLRPIREAKDLLDRPGRAPDPYCASGTPRQSDAKPPMHPQTSSIAASHHILGSSCVLWVDNNPRALLPLAMLPLPPSSNPPNGTQDTDSRCLWLTSCVSVPVYGGAVRVPAAVDEPERGQPR